MVWLVMHMHMHMHIMHMHVRMHMHMCMHMCMHTAHAKVDVMELQTGMALVLLLSALAGPAVWDGSVPLPLASLTSVDRVGMRTLVRVGVATGILASLSNNLRLVRRACHARPQQDVQGVQLGVQLATFVGHTLLS